jgi:hypothetical protein
MIVTVLAAASFAIRVDWTRGVGAMASAEVYESGAGISNDSIAFHLKAADVARLKKAAEVMAPMPDHFGEVENDFLKFRGKVAANGKTVVQYIDGPQSEELSTLAAEVLTTAEKAARANGVTAKDLPDALKKLASGAIPLEALHVAAQSRSIPGWLIQIHGYDITVRPFEKGGYGKAITSRLSRKTLLDLVKLLRDAPSFPRNLYAPDYGELRVDVLGRAVDFQARPYAGVTPTTHGAKQRAYDKIMDWLQRVGLPQPLR